ncbi:alpha/beta hydrolase [Oceanirhabdus seepicola]|uniref:Alpha/beta fold hydrolase n=1 Tax=Oceanirhabdus seepicola TaxID=2828781 RepID=A0A9J6P0U6_9CLOT|nr:alpha/beta fold hydrolase [Oceanirhabdus seepicola]MCM1989729.1 alpha/beta fold hydrolase [Oceanirhabdus seepicola]
MEKINFNNSRGLKIVGNLYGVGSKTLIIMAHGFTNNKLSNGRFDSLAEDLSNIGYDALAIDFSGCGESDDDAITSKNQVDDLNSAIDFALSKGYTKIGLFGNSFGTLACLRSYRKEVITMVLVGALTDRMDYDWNDYFSQKQMNDLHTQGFFYLGTDRMHKITKQTLMDFKEINQKELLRNVDCSILIFHGNNSEDEEEVQLLERSKRAINMMKHNSRLEIIKNAKHGIRNDWDKVIEITCDWYSKYIE